MQVEGNMTPLMYQPDRKYLYKIYLQVTLTGIVILLISALLGFLIGRNELGPVLNTQALYLGITVNFLWIVPTFVLINHHYHSLHYEIHEDELIVHIGVITKTTEHIPFRTVTYIKVKRGPFDRFFGLGTIDIQTAGRCGEDGAEGSLTGLSNFREVYNQLASAIRSQ
jgi:membrane protein YdbS with pleckstrin-like domain